MSTFNECSFAELFANATIDRSRQHG